MRRLGQSLRARLTLVVSLAGVLAALLVAAGLFFAVQRFLLDAQLARLTVAAGVVEGRLDRALGRGFLDLSDLRDPDFPVDVTVRVAGQGGELGRTTGFPNGIPENLPPGNYRLAQRLVLVRAAYSRSGPITVTLVTGSRGLLEARAAFLRALALLLPFALAPIALVAWIIAGRVLRPVRTLEATARDIGESGDLMRPVPGAGERDELSRLALALQGAFRQVAATRAREQEFIRAAAHDLRAPLTATRARVALALGRDRDAARYRADLAEIDADLARLARLANHLLTLARDPAALARLPVSLANVVADAVDRAREAAPDTWIDWNTFDKPTVPGDALLLGQAVENLLGNALRHARGANVTVSVAREGAFALVRVHDDGPGVSAAVLARLGEAFYRPDTSRAGEGHGLGLAIAKRVAELHGGTLALRGAPGGGFTAELRLPLAPP